MRVAALSDKGMARAANQDSIFTSIKPVGCLPNLYIVADGMGGEKAGGYASNSAIEYLLAYMTQNSTGNVNTKKENKPSKVLADAICYANMSIYKEALNNDSLHGMGTTLVAASITEGILYVCNVGDSRLYIVNDSIRQITRDHSYVEEMVLKGFMDRNSIEYEQNKNLITRAVGVKKDIDIDIFEMDFNDRDVILLCSDGLTNMLYDDDILETVRNAGDIDNAAKTLVALANNRGGVDNISVILVTSDNYGVDEVDL